MLLIRDMSILPTIAQHGAGSDDTSIPRAVGEWSVNLALLPYCSVVGKDVDGYPGKMGLYVCLFFGCFTSRQHANCISGTGLPRQLYKLLHRWQDSRWRTSFQVNGMTEPGKAGSNPVSATLESDALPFGQRAVNGNVSLKRTVTAKTTKKSDIRTERPKWSTAIRGIKLITTSATQFPAFTQSSIAPLGNTRKFSVQSRSSLSLPSKR